MLLWEIAEGIAGVLLVLALLLDVFLSVVVPRRAPNLGRMIRVSNLLIPGLWSGWRELGLRLSSAERRESLLCIFGALAVNILLLAWAAGLVLDYGLILHALRAQVRPVPEDLGTAVYFAGVSLLTIGFGDIVAMEAPARLVGWDSAPQPSDDGSKMLHERDRRSEYIEMGVPQEWGPPLYIGVDSHPGRRSAGHSAESSDQGGPGRGHGTAAHCLCEVFGPRGRDAAGSHDRAQIAATAAGACIQAAGAMRTLSWTHERDQTYGPVRLFSLKRDPTDG